MLFSLCAVVSACSDENDKGTSTATLEIVEEFVDFKENGESQTIVITTNQAEWSATVESNGKGWCRILPDINPGNHKLTISVTPQYGKRTAEHDYYRKGSRVIGENNCTSIGNG